MYGMDCYYHWQGQCLKCMVLSLAGTVSEKCMVWTVIISGRDSVGNEGYGLLLSLAGTVSVI